MPAGRHMAARNNRAILGLMHIRWKMLSITSAYSEGHDQLAASPRTRRRRSRPRPSRRAGRPRLRLLMQQPLHPPARGGHAVHGDLAPAGLAFLRCWARTWRVVAPQPAAWRMIVSSQCAARNGLAVLRCSPVNGDSACNRLIMPGSRLSKNPYRRNHEDKQDRHSPSPGESSANDLGTGPRPAEGQGAATAP